MRTDQLGANSSCLPNTSLKEAIDLIRNMGFHGITLLAFANTRHRYGNLAGFWFRDMNEPEQQELKGLLSGFDRRALTPRSSTCLLFLTIQNWNSLPTIEFRSDRCRRIPWLPGRNSPPCLPAELLPSEYWDHMVAVFKSLEVCRKPRGEAWY